MFELNRKHAGRTQDLETVLAEIKRQFHEVETRSIKADLVRVELKQDELLPLLGWLKGSTPFVQLTHITVVDWLEEGQFELIYLVTAPQLCRTLMISVRIDREKAQAESVYSLWLQAETYEQEINEMFGINFPGSPRQGVPFILEGWQDMPPMRRDFDTVAYTRKTHPERPGREHTDSRTYVGRKFGEKGYLS